MTGPWRTRDFRLVTAGQAVTRLGTGITAIAFPLTAVLPLRTGSFRLGGCGLTAAPIFVVRPPLRGAREVTETRSP